MAQFRKTPTAPILDHFVNLFSITLIFTKTARVIDKTAAIVILFLE